MMIMANHRVGIGDYANKVLRRGHKGRPVFCVQKGNCTKGNCTKKHICTYLTQNIFVHI